jgi:hypothetical protein
MAGAVGCGMRPGLPPTAFSFKDLFMRQEATEEDGADLGDALSALASLWPAEITFTAAELVAKLCGGSGVATLLTDKDPAAVDLVRDFLFSDLANSPRITAKAVSKRLKRHLDNPVMVAGRTLALKANRGSVTEILKFQVAVKK